MTVLFATVLHKFCNNKYLAQIETNNLSCAPYLYDNEEEGDGYRPSTLTATGIQGESTLQKIIVEEICDSGLVRPNIVYRRNK